MKPIIRSVAADRETSIQTTEWPLVTKTLLANSINSWQRDNPDELNERIFALLRGRVALQNARLQLQFCARIWKADKKMAKRLAQLSKKLAAIETRYPLSVV